MIDTYELRRLAQAATHPATKGRWMRLFGERTVYDRMEDGCRGTPVVATPTSPPDKAEAAKLDFIAAANPANITDLLDRLEATEIAQKISDQTIYDLRAENAALVDDMNLLRDNNTALRTKVEQMEKQEPVEWQSRTRPVWNDGMWTQWSKCSEGYAKDIMKASLVNDWIYEARPLYALPGAQGEEK